MGKIQPLTDALDGALAAAREIAGPDVYASVSASWSGSDGGLTTVTISHGAPVDDDELDVDEQLREPTELPNEPSSDEYRHARVEGEWT